MAELNPFYTVNSWDDKVITGGTLKIVHSLWFSDYNAAPHLTPLVELTAAELQEQLTASKDQEKAIFEKLKAATAEWEQQAAQTLLLEKAIEYVQTSEVSHTSNEWKRMDNGTWEISNRVYQMRYHFDPVPQSKAVRVSWGIKYNAPRQPGNPRYANSWGDSLNIAGQEKKLYDNLDAAQRYIQGRFDLYAHLFTELSPPVPNDCKRMFTVNGKLLPGYTLAPAERSREQNLDDLLDCLEDGDIAPPLEKEPPSAKGEKTAVKKKSAPKKSSPVR